MRKAKIKKIICNLLLYNVKTKIVLLLHTMTKPILLENKFKAVKYDHFGKTYFVHINKLFQLDNGYYVIVFIKPKL